MLTAFGVTDATELFILYSDKQSRRWSHELRVSCLLGTFLLYFSAMILIVGFWWAVSWTNPWTSPQSPQKFCSNRPINLDHSITWKWPQLNPAQQSHKTTKYLGKILWDFISPYLISSSIEDTFRSFVLFVRIWLLFAYCCDQFFYLFISCNCNVRQTRDFSSCHVIEAHHHLQNIFYFPKLLWP